MDDLPRIRTEGGGLVPLGAHAVLAKDTKIGFQCINAKAETVAEKPAFRSAFKKKRCLIVADGFYEWQKTTGPDGKERKQAMRICRKDCQPFAFAGLWEWWQLPPAVHPVTPVAHGP